MQVIRTNTFLTQALDDCRAKGKRLAFVPTMGALHAGHLSLVEIAKKHADAVIVSIFVNPTQFGPNEDFAQYPRQEEKDSALLETVGTDMVWFPDAADIYPAGAHATLKAPPQLANILCGLDRPGHFDGVVTVVMRLFDLVQPDAAVFGEKDWQQLTIIRAVAAQHHPEIAIISAPILREADGLAMSSRNAYLTPPERVLASHLYRTLLKVAAEIRAGTLVPVALAEGINELKMNGFLVDYLEMREPSALKPALTPPARLLVAARLGATRLIDNLPV